MNQRTDVLVITGEMRGWDKFVYVEQLPDACKFAEGFVAAANDVPWMFMEGNPDDGVRLRFEFDNGQAIYRLTSHDLEAEVWDGQLVSWSPR